MINDFSSHDRAKAFRRLLVSQVESDSLSRYEPAYSRRWLPAALVTTGIVVVGSLAFYSSSGQGEPLPLATADAVAEPHQGSGDETIASNPSELAAGAQVVVLGTVIGVEETRAPHEVPQPYGVVTTFTMVVSIDETLQGPAATSSDGSLRIAVPAFPTSAGGKSVDEYLKLIPLNSAVVAYVDRGWPANGGMVNSDPGYAGAEQVPLYIPTTSQSLAIQPEKSPVVSWPVSGTVREGNIRDALPGGTLVPLVAK